MELTQSNFIIVNDIDKDKFILEELKVNKNGHKYNDLKMVLDKVRGAAYSFTLNDNYKLKQVYADIDFIQEYYGFPFFILAEAQRLIQMGCGETFDINHKEELVGTDTLFEFEYEFDNSIKKQQLIKPTECGN